MGYRHYFYKVDIADVNGVKDMTMPELLDYTEAVGAKIWDEEDTPIISFNDPKFLNKEEVFGFGKLSYEDTAQRIYDTGVPLFSREEVQEQFSDYVPYVVGKEAVLLAIKIYEEKIKNYYNSLLEHKDGLTKDGITPSQAAIMHVREKVDRLSWSSYIDTREDKKYSLTTSWEYEYSIFNLVHILKTINWDKETLLFYGW